jgi:hypothetical protein
LFFDRSQGAEPFTWIFENANSLTLQASNGVQAINYFASNFFTNYTNKYINIAITIKHDPENSEVKFYRNGELFRTINTTQILFPDQNTTKRIGSYSNYGSHSWVGNIKEFKLYNKILDENIIKTKYNNESSPEEFYSVGDLEIDVEKKELIAWVKIPYLSSTEDTEIYLNFGDKVLRSNDADTWDAGQVGVWNFNEKTGTTIYDSSGTNNPGIIYNAKFINNKFHKSGLDFYTSTSRAVISTIPALGNSWSLHAWIKLNENYFDIEKPYNMFLSRTRPYFSIQPNRRIALSWTNTNGIQAALFGDLTDKIEFNQWYSITGTHDGNIAKIYVNGNEIKRTSSTAANTSSGYL